MKTLLLILALAASPAMAQEPKSLTGSFITSMPQPEFLTIIGGHKDFLVKISLKDGSVIFGPDYTPDETVRIFWAAMERTIPRECKPPPSLVGIKLSGEIVIDWDAVEKAINNPDTTDAHTLAIARLMIAIVYGTWKPMK